MYEEFVTSTKAAPSIDCIGSEYGEWIKRVSLLARVDDHPFWSTKLIECMYSTESRSNGRGPEPTQTIKNRDTQKAPIASASTQL
jgi:hypothetical protein